MSCIIIKATKKKFKNFFVESDIVIFFCVIAESDAEVLRKKVYLKNQKIQENKLSLAQINGRLSELRDKKDLLEEEKRALLEQKQNTDHTALKKLEIK